MNKWKTTDKLYELPLYNENGYLNRSYVIKLLIISFVFIFIISNLFINYILYVKDAEYINILEIFNYQFFKFYFIDYISFVKSQAININYEFVLSLILSLSISIYFEDTIFNKIKELAKIQRNMSSLKLEQYYLIKHDKKNRLYIFKLKKGEMSRFDFFRDKTDDFQQLFELEKTKIERLEDDKVIVKYSEALPCINTAPKLNYEEKLGKGKYFLGIEDTEGTPIYATEKENGKGLLNGNWLIVGGSGSGKSFAVKEQINNMLLEENYKFIDKIYVINYKSSADYNFLKGLDKFRYADNIPDGLKLLKQILLDMKAKYKYNSLKSEDNFTAYQTIIIVDEVQTLNEILESKAIHRIMKNTVAESLSILEQLASKIRASNGSLINILQKADVSSLPSTAYRSNLRNRFMLKQENVSSAHLVVNSDTTTEVGINPLRLKQGQYLYWDMLTNELKNGFVVMSGYNPDNYKLNKISLDSEALKVYKKVKELKKDIIKELEEEKKIMEKMEEDGVKTFADDFEIEEDIEEVIEEDIEEVIEEVIEEDINVEENVEEKKKIDFKEIAKKQMESKLENKEIAKKQMESKLENKEINELDLFNSL